MLGLIIFFLLFHPAVEHDLGMGGVCRGLLPASAVEGRDQASARAAQVVDCRLWQGALLHLFGKLRPAFGGFKGAIGIFQRLEIIGLFCF
jgi:hypothetical protein